VSAYLVTLFPHVAGAITTCVGVGPLFFAVVALGRARRAEEILILVPVYYMGTVIGLLASWSSRFGR